MPLATQMVQVGHACLEAGHRFTQPARPCHLVLLAVPSVAELETAVEWARLWGITCAVFEEPDDNLGPTAACTEPITDQPRRLFRHLPLWQATLSDSQGRGPPAPLVLWPLGIFVVSVIFG